MLSSLLDSIQNRLIQSHCVSFTNYVLYCSLILIYKFCQIQIYSKPHFILHFTECQNCNPRRTVSQAMFSFLSVCIVSASFSVATALEIAPATNLPAINLCTIYSEHSPDFSALAKSCRHLDHLGELMRANQPALPSILLGSQCHWQRRPELFPKRPDPSSSDLPGLHY